MGEFNVTHEFLTSQQVPIIERISLKCLNEVVKETDECLKTDLPMLVAFAKKEQEGKKRNVVAVKVNFENGSTVKGAKVFSKRAYLIEEYLEEILRNMSNKRNSQIKNIVVLFLNKDGEPQSLDYMNLRIISLIR